MDNANDSMCAKSNCLVNTVKEARCASKFPGKHSLNLALSFIRMKKASSQSLWKCDQLELSLLLLIEAWKKKKASFWGQTTNIYFLYSTATWKKTESSWLVEIWLATKDQPIISNCYGKAIKLLPGLLMLLFNKKKPLGK